MPHQQRHSRPGILPIIAAIAEQAEAPSAPHRAMSGGLVMLTTPRCLSIAPISRRREVVSQSQAITDGQNSLRELNRLTSRIRAPLARRALPPLCQPRPFRLKFLFSVRTSVLTTTGRSKKPSQNRISFQAHRAPEPRDKSYF